jgi:aminomethyltransferase
MYPSPFHARLTALNETWKYKEWAGLIAPARFIENHIYEYTAFRQSAGLLDVTPLYKYEFTGADAATFLARVTSKDVRKLKLGRVTYLCWCDDDGKVVDDGTVSRTGEQTFLLTAAEPQYAWFLTLSRGFDVVITDVSRSIAALAVQGPTSRAVLAACTDIDMAALKFFATTTGTLAGRAVRVSRTGYTGDLGYEVWCQNDDALAVWDALIDAGRAHDLVPAGLDALDMTRIEAGFVLLGVDYFSAPRVTLSSKKVSPAEIGLDFAVELERDPWVGQQALKDERARGGPAKCLVGLDLSWDDIEALYGAHDLGPQLSTMASRESLPIYLHGEQVGRVSSSTRSPTLKRYIALATVKRTHAAVGTVLDVEHTVLFERRIVRATVVERPFFDPERKRKP